MAKKPQKPETHEEGKPHMEEGPSHREESGKKKKPKKGK